jgi:Sugar (and other) transporter
MRPLCLPPDFWSAPIGSWLFGHLADSHGRRNTLFLTVLMMCFGSLMIAAIPTYTSIGLAAPALLGLARVIQGLSLGGEYGISAAYLCEVADEKRRGFYSSFQYVTIIGGQLCAILVLLALQKLVLTSDELRAWGWRIPFVIGAGLAVVSALMRRYLHETPAFLATTRSIRPRSPLANLLEHPREALLRLPTRHWALDAVIDLIHRYPAELIDVVHLADGERVVIVRRMAGIMKRSTKSWAVAVLAAPACRRPQHHSAREKEYCPSLSTVARQRTPDRAGATSGEASRTRWHSPLAALCRSARYPRISCLGRRRTVSGCTLQNINIHLTQASRPTVSEPRDLNRLHFG